MPIQFSEIQPGDLVQVLANIDDVDDELYAIARDHFTDYIVINYFADTTMTYKGAPVYELEDKEELAQPENLLAHYPGGDNPFVNLENNLYYRNEEGYDSELESVILHDSSDDEDLEDFIVDDNEVDGIVIPPRDSKTIDKEWNEWEPTSPGAKRYKNTVDTIEEFARHHADENNFNVF
jgi:hypothetical protein